MIRNCEFRDDGGYHSWSMRVAIAYPGTYDHCTAAYCAFGGYGGTASGTFTHCTGTDYAFGGLNGTTSGTFTNYTGGQYSFGGESGTASGTFTHCTGGQYSFGGDYGTASGTFTDCTGGNDAFGGFNSATTGARLSGCRMTGTWSGTWDGTMQDCQWSFGVTVGANARIYNSKFLGNVNLNSTAAGIANSYVKGTIQNTGSASFNSGNVESASVN